MKTGDQIVVKQRLYLARWVEAGEKGEIIKQIEPGKFIVKLEDAHDYVLVAGEMELDTRR